MRTGNDFCDFRLVPDLASHSIRPLGSARTCVMQTVDVGVGGACSQAADSHASPGKIARRPWLFNYVSTWAKARREV